MRDKLQRTYWAFTNQFGLEPLRAWRALLRFPGYLADYSRFRREFKGQMVMLPCLHDKYQQSGDANSEYFLQDLLVARKIFDANPEKHVDVGSRVDGFVAHVAAFRTIEVLDIRPTDNEIAGIKFRQANLMDTASTPAAYCDSLSCLHALEHFGLGRYGDPLNPRGWMSGLASLSRILQSGGRLYLSTPVGKEKIFFNAHRVFVPSDLIEHAKQNGLTLDGLSWISKGRVHTSVNPDDDIAALGRQEYSLGIFEFSKV